MDNDTETRKIIGECERESCERTIYEGERMEGLETHRATRYEPADGITVCGECYDYLTEEPDYDDHDYYAAEYAAALSNHYDN